MPRIPTVEIELNGVKTIVNADDPRAQAIADKETGAAIPTKSDIATMKKLDCIDWLEAHGADTDGNIGELRDRLRNVMFVGV